MRHTYLVSYDIADDKRLRKVFKTCRNYGNHLQYSVFECRLSGAGYEKLVGDLLAVIDPAQDSIHLYHFVGDVAASRRRLGQGRDIEVGGPWLA